MYSEDDIKKYVEEQGYTFLTTEFRRNKKNISKRWILVKCGIHDEYWVSWSNFKKGRRCPECKKYVLRKDKEIEDYLNLIDFKLLNIERIDKKTIITVKCPHNHIFRDRYDSIKRRETKCYECENKSKPIKKEEDMIVFVENEGYEVLKIEKGYDDFTYINVICPNKHEWKTRFYSFKGGCRCPFCNISKGERKIIDWLENNNIKYIYNKPYFNDLLSPLGNPLKPDFIIENKKIWIEYDGEFHYKKVYEEQNFTEIQIHDKTKDEYAKKNNWKLIRIPYWDFDNIEEILREVLL